MWVVDIKLLLTLLLIGIMVLLGCIPKVPDIVEPTAQVVKQIEKSASKTQIVEKEEIKDTKKIQNQTTEKILKEKPTKFYDLNQLEEDIKEMVNITYNFTIEPSHPDYVRSSFLKYYVIHITKNKEEFVDNVGEFCEKYCAANWDGWQYYINMSDYRSLFPLLSRSDFPTEEKYREYLRDATYVNYTFVETSYDLEHGKVLEYQLLSWRIDNSLKYFEGARDGTFLIYKIYCSPNMTILIMPRWEVYKILLPSMTLEDSYKTWKSYIISIRSEFLNKSNELLKKCSVNKEFFENYEFPDYHKSEMLTDYWKFYYGKMFKLNSLLSASAKLKSGGKYVLNQVNVSFTNSEDIDFWNAEVGEGVNLKIDVTADGEREISYYDHRVTGILEPGKSINRSFEHKEVEFFNNITIRAVLYVEEKVESMPLERTFTKKDFFKE